MLLTRAETIVWEVENPLPSKHDICLMLANCAAEIRSRTLFSWKMWFRGVGMNSILLGSLAG